VLLERTAHEARNESLKLQSLGAGQTHFLYIGYFHPNGATEAEVQGMLRDFYHAVFAGIGRVLNVNFTIQQ
jgi:hypothetical protein